MVPEFVVLENREGQINLNTSEWMILSKIDGARSVKAIAQASGLSVFDAAKILYGLIATGLIRLKEREHNSPAPVAASASRGNPRPAAAAAATATPVPGTLAAAGNAPQAQPAAGADLMAKLNRVREICNALLGTVGESVVNKHYQKARAEIDRGAGFEAVEEAINQIARAASILKGPAVTEALLEQLKGVRRSD
jgi:hypothetical protein